VECRRRDGYPDEIGFYSALIAVILSESAAARSASIQGINLLETVQSKKRICFSRVAHLNSVILVSVILS